MLLLGDLSDQTEADFLHLATGGMKSSMRQLEQSFSNYWLNWNLKLSAAASQASSSSQTGDSELNERLTKRQGDLFSLRNDTLNSMSGYARIWTDINLDDVEGL